MHPVPLCLLGCSQDPAAINPQETRCDMLGLDAVMLRSLLPWRRWRGMSLHPLCTNACLWLLCHCHPFCAQRLKALVMTSLCFVPIEP